jgi:hypothetical protein
MSWHRRDGILVLRRARVLYSKLQATQGPRSCPWHTVLSQTYVFLSYLVPRLTSVLDKCSITECRSSFVDSKGFNFQRCPRHTCGLQGCNREARTRGSRSPFCFDHRCVNDDCQNLAKIKNGYCRKEACLQPECGLPKIDGYEDYCLNHKPKPPSTRGDYPTPVLPSSRSTRRSWRLSSSGSRPMVIYGPPPSAMKYLWGSSRTPESREWQYAQMNNAFQDSTPRHLRH